MHYFFYFQGSRAIASHWVDSPTKLFGSSVTPQNQVKVQIESQGHLVNTEDITLMGEEEEERGRRKEVPNDPTSGERKKKE